MQLFHFGDIDQRVSARRATLHQDIAQGHIGKTGFRVTDVLAALNQFGLPAVRARYFNLQAVTIKIRLSLQISTTKTILFE